MYYPKVAPVRLPNIWKFWKNIKAKPLKFHIDKNSKQNKKKKTTQTQNKTKTNMPEEAWTTIGLKSSA